MTTLWKQGADLNRPIGNRRSRLKQAIVRPLRERPSAFLLGAQMLAMLSLPFAGPNNRAPISILGLIIVVLAIVTVRSTPALTWLSALIAFPALVLEIWTIADQGNDLVFELAHLLLGSFYLYVGCALIAYVFADHWVTKDELFAVGAAFTVIAWSFAYFYLVVQALWPGSFVAYQGPGERSFHELLYLSMASLTSVGLSDVMPVLPQARGLVMVEQLVGVLYVTMVISRLVALTAMRRS